LPLNSEKRQSSLFCCIANFLLKNKNTKIPIYLQINKLFDWNQVFLLFCFCNSHPLPILLWSSAVDHTKGLEEEEVEDLAPTSLARLLCCWQWLNTFFTSWLSTHLCKIFFFFKYVFAKHHWPPPSKSDTFRWFERFTIFKIYSQQNLVDVDDAFSLFFRVELKHFETNSRSSACSILSILSNSKIGFSTKWILFLWFN
jgi:hypothetical protein